MAFFRGFLPTGPPADLGGMRFRPRWERGPGNGTPVDEVLMGCVLLRGRDGNRHRQRASRAVWVRTFRSHDTDKMCGSGMKAAI